MRKSLGSLPLVRRDGIANTTAVSDTLDDHSIDQSSQVHDISAPTVTISVCQTAHPPSTRTTAVPVARRVEQLISPRLDRLMFRSPVRINPGWKTKRTKNGGDSKNIKYRVSATTYTKRLSLGIKKQLQTVSLWSGIFSASISYRGLASFINFPLAALILWLLHLHFLLCDLQQFDHTGPWVMVPTRGAIILYGRVSSRTSHAGVFCVFLKDFGVGCLFLVTKFLGACTRAQFPMYIGPQPSLAASGGADERISVTRRQPGRRC